MKDVFDLFKLKDHDGECLATHYHVMGDRAREKLGLEVSLGEGDTENISVEYMEQKMLRKL